MPAIYEDEEPENVFHLKLDVADILNSDGQAASQCQRSIPSRQEFENALNEFVFEEPKKNWEGIINEKNSLLFHYEDLLFNLSSLSEFGFLITKFTSNKYSVVKISTLLDKREERHLDVCENYDDAVKFALKLRSIKPMMWYTAKAYFNRGFNSEFIEGSVQAESREVAKELLQVEFKKKIAKIDKECAEDFEIVLNQPSE